MSHDAPRAEPTDEDVAAIVAVLISQQSCDESNSGNQPSNWIQHARRESVENWPQPQGLSSDRVKGNEH